MHPSISNLTEPGAECIALFSVSMKIMKIKTSSPFERTDMMEFAVAVKMVFAVSAGIFRRDSVMSLSAKPKRAKSGDDVTEANIFAIWA